MRLADVQFSGSDRAVVARVVGEIDLSNAESIGAAMLQAVPNHALALVLDLSAVAHLDSAGIQLVYRLRESLRARDQVLRLAIPASSPAADALRLAGISNHIETLETVGEALRALV